MEDQNFKFRIYLQEVDKGFSPTLIESINILKSFSDTYNFCLHRAYKRYTDEDHFPIEPVMRLDYAKKGSFDALSWIDFPASYAMIKPLVGSYSWETFKNTFEFVKVLFSRFNKKEYQPLIKIENSPGSTNILTTGNNNLILVGTDVFECAKRQSDNIQELAKRIGAQYPASLSITRLGLNDVPADSILIDAKTKSDYIADDIEHIQDEPIKILCRIYKLNIKTKIGTLEPLDDSLSEKTLGFEILSGMIDDYAEALKRNQCTILAKPRILTTPFGERRVTYLYPIEISL